MPVRGSFNLEKGSRVNECYARDDIADVLQALVDGIDCCFGADCEKVALFLV